MKHIYIDNKSKHTFLLLHGTGGDEHDLLSLAKYIQPSFNVLSVRGDIQENGMNRFFKRLSEGIFDEEDLVFRTHQLYEFLDLKAIEYGLDRANVVALGYSNGANIAASILFHYSNAFEKAILLHPMVPIRKDLPDLSQVDVFIGAGKNDPICPFEQSIELERLLSNANAKVHLHWENNGHRLSQSEIDAVKVWLN